MGSYSQTRQQDYRTLVEGEEVVVAGPEAALSMPGSVQLGAGATYSVTQPGVAPEAVAGLVSSRDVTIEQLIGLAGGIFQDKAMLDRSLAEQQAATQRAVAALSQPAAPAPAAAPAAAVDWSKYVPLVIVGVIVALLAGALK